MTSGALDTISAIGEIRVRKLLSNPNGPDADSANCANCSGALDTISVIGEIRVRTSWLESNG
jgi:hypothetical protein